MVTSCSVATAHKPNFPMTATEELHGERLWPPRPTEWYCVTIICGGRTDGVTWAIHILCENWMILFQEKLLIFQERCCMLRNILSCKACYEAGSQHFKTLPLNTAKLNCKWKTDFNSWQMQAPYVTSAMPISRMRGASGLLLNNILQWYLFQQHSWFNLVQCYLRVNFNNLISRWRKFPPAQHLDWCGWWCLLNWLTLFIEHGTHFGPGQSRYKHSSLLQCTSLNNSSWQFPAQGIQVGYDSISETFTVTVQFYSLAYYSLFHVHIWGLEF